MTAIRPRKPSGPGGCAAMASSAGSTVFSTPVTLVSKTARAWAAGSVAPPVPAEIPALAMARSSRPAPAIQPAMAAASRTSSTRGRAVAPAAVQAAATAASRARIPAAERCSTTPGAGAGQRQRPAEAGGAPVTSTCRQGHAFRHRLHPPRRAGQPAAWASL